MLYLRTLFNADLAPSHVKHMDMRSKWRVNLAWHKLVRAVQKNFSKTCLLNKLLLMFYLKMLMLPAENIANKHTFN